MATITLRSAKGSPLTNNEVDANFTNLNSDKYESGSNVTLGTVSGSTVTFSGILTSSAYTVCSVNGTISAAGTTQGAATALAKSYNIVTSATAASATARDKQCAALNRGSSRRLHCIAGAVESALGMGAQRQRASSPEASASSARSAEWRCGEARSPSESKQCTPDRVA